MKVVILKKQYLHFQPGQELSFVDDSQVDRLIDGGIARLKEEKGLEMPLKDKMIRRAKTKAVIR